MAKIYISPSDIKEDYTTTANGVIIKEYLLKNHNVNNLSLPTKRVDKFLGVTIHNTEDLANVADDGRQYTAASVNGNMGGVYTTYYVDELYAWQNLEWTDMNWTCGDYSTGKGSKQTISLEVIMDGATGNNNIKARDNAARLAAYILYKHNMTVNNMFTHNYWLNIRNGVKGDYYTLCTKPTVTRTCPYYIIPDWENFRKQVDNYIVKLGGKSIYTNVDSTQSVKPLTEINVPVKYIMQSIGSAAIRTSTEKTENNQRGRVTKGSYYPIDARIVKPNGELWLKHASQSRYSMYRDNDVLFKKVGDYTICKTTVKLNIRSLPSLSGDKIGVLSQGTYVYVFNGSGTKANGYTWVKIVADEKIGYVAKEYLINN